MNAAAADAFFGGKAVGRALEDARGGRIDVVGVVRQATATPAPDDRPRVFLFERQSPAAAAEDDGLREFIVPLAAPEGLVQTDIAAVVVSPGYFEGTTGTIASGRGFDTAADDRCDVVVVNKEAALEYFGGAAVGGAIIDGDGRRAEIVGVVDAGALRVMARRGEPAVYFPWDERYLPRMAVIAQTSHASPEMVAEIGRRLRSVPGGASVPVAMTLEERLARTSLGPERIAMVLIGAAAVISLGLGLLGAYGVMADSVRQKKREIALQLALGAPGWRIVAGVFRDGARSAAAGSAAGLAVAAALTAGAARGSGAAAVPAAWMWLACPVVLLAVVALASVLPARWALAVDPLTLTREG